MRSILGIFFLSLCWSGLFISLGVFSGWVTISASVPWLINPAAFIYRHLRLSVVPFGCLFIMYFYFLSRIRRHLRRKETKLSELIYYDRLLNTTISTFFGVGVIWTAVGMESSLMQALDGVRQGQEVSATLSAWRILDRLVNGGLLLALSTTVVGGVCGYLLRLLKIVLIGKNWDLFILEEAGENGTAGAAQE